MKTLQNKIVTDSKVADLTTVWLYSAAVKFHLKKVTNQKGNLLLVEPKTLKFPFPTVIVVYVCQAGGSIHFP